MNKKEEEEEALWYTALCIWALLKNQQFKSPLLNACI